MISAAEACTKENLTKSKDFQTKTSPTHGVSKIERSKIADRR